MSLRAKLILSFFGVVLLTSLCGLALSYNQMRDSFRQDLRGNLQALASSIATQIDGDYVSSLQSEADEATEDYRALRQRLIRVKERLPGDVRFIYVYRPSNEPGKVQMVVGGEPLDAPEDEVTHFALADYSRAEFPSLYEGFEKAAADEDLTYEPAFGYSLSGYAPVFDRSGQKVAAVGVDYSANSIHAKEQALLTLLGISSLAALLVALAVGYVLARLITRPLLELVSATERIAGGDLQAEVSIDRKDEIGRLARSFNKMVRNLRDMASALQGYATQAVQSKELEVASKLQRSLVPQHPLEAPGVEVAAGLRAVEFGGGTTYDYFLFGQNAYLVFVLARVEAIGLDATSLITTCKGGLSSLISNCIFRPQEIARQMNLILAENASGTAVGYLCGVYDLGQGWLTLVNAGHAYPYVLRPEAGELVQLDRDSGVALGKDGMAEYADFDVRMQRGDVLIAYSPYVTEVRNAAGEVYGLTRLEEAIRRNGKLAPAELKEALLDELSAFHGTAAPLDDDLALLVVRFEPPAQA